MSSLSLHPLRVLAEVRAQATRLLKDARSPDTTRQQAARARVAAQQSPRAMGRTARGGTGTLQYRHALEIVAREWGFPSWDVLRLGARRGVIPGGILVGPATRWHLALLPGSTTLREAGAHLDALPDSTFEATFRPQGLTRALVRPSPRGVGGVVLPKTVRATADRARMQRELAALRAAFGDACRISHLRAGDDAPADLAVRVGPPARGVTRDDVLGLRGRFIDGQTDDDVTHAFRVLSVWTGVHLICVWDVVDCWGAGGDSEFHVLLETPQGPRLGAFPAALWTYLCEGDEAVDPAHLRAIAVAPYTSADRAAHDLPPRRMPARWDRYNFAWRIDTRRELR